MARGVGMESRKKLPQKKVGEFESKRVRGLKIKEGKTPGDGRIKKEIGNSESVERCFKRNV
ncbi:hypothetical protein [Chryseobacterium sp.]|uniref:hypothetical protein n=1 Tax=Chryseobacterium sp. TaxID=1871047 RepID=UPI0023EF8936|nr:hypothetical protein [Chryseobacterium sp.]